MITITHIKVVYSSSFNNHNIINNLLEVYNRFNHHLLIILFKVFHSMVGTLKIACNNFNSTNHLCSSKCRKIYPKWTTKWANNNLCMANKIQDLISLSLSLFLSKLDSNNNNKHYNIDKSHLIRPVRLLRVWISEGLTQANS